MSGGSRRSSEMKRSNRRSLVAGSTAVIAEAIADCAVRGRSTPLAQDRRIERTRECDDVVDGQEVSREVELLDQLQLVVELGQHLVGNLIAPALVRAKPGQMFEMLLRRPVLRHRLPADIRT